MMEVTVRFHVDPTDSDEVKVQECFEQYLRDMLDVGVEDADDDPFLLRDLEVIEVSIGDAGYYSMFTSVLGRQLPGRASVIDTGGGFRYLQVPVTLFGQDCEVWLEWAHPNLQATWPGGIPTDGMRANGAPLGPWPGSTIGGCLYMRTEGELEQIGVLAGARWTGTLDTLARALVRQIGAAYNTHRQAKTHRIERKVGAYAIRLMGKLEPTHWEITGPNGHVVSVHPDVPIGLLEAVVTRTLVASELAGVRRAAIRAACGAFDEYEANRELRDVADSPDERSPL